MKGLVVIGVLLFAMIAWSMWKVCQVEPASLAGVYVVPTMPKLTVPQVRAGHAQKAIQHPKHQSIRRTFAGSV